MYKCTCRGCGEKFILSKTCSVVLVHLYVCNCQCNVSIMYRSHILYMYVHCTCSYTWKSRNIFHIMLVNWGSVLVYIHVHVKNPGLRLNIHLYQTSKLEVHQQINCCYKCTCTMYMYVIINFISNEKFSGLL